MKTHLERVTALKLQLLKTELKTTTKKLDTLYSFANEVSGQESKGVLITHYQERVTALKTDINTYNSILFVMVHEKTNY